MKEYKIGKFYAAFIIIFALLFIALFGFLLFMPLLSGFENDIKIDVYYYFIVPLSLIMITVFSIGFLDTIKGKFIIDNRKITSVGAFSQKELLLNEIKGYKITDKYVFIFPKKEDQKRIKIASQTAKIEEVKKWLKENYPDLDLQEAENEKKEILNNPEFGWSQKDREKTLKRAAKTAKIFNWFGGIIAGWTFLFPKPYSLAIIICILVPIIGLIVLKYFKGLIRLDTKIKSGYPSIFVAIFFSCMAVCIRGLLDFEIYDYSNVWFPMVLIGLCYISFFAIGNPEFKLGQLNDFFSILGFVICIFGYSYGIVVSLNCIFDTSKPVHYNSTVLSKRINSGKNKTYHLKLTPWGNQTEADEVSVSQDEYETFNPNDAVNIYLMKGKFEIPWFEISK